MVNFKSSLLLTAILFIIIYSCNDHKKDIIDQTHRPAKLKEDLVILRGLLDEVHAGAYAYTDKKTFDRLFDSLAATITTSLNEREFLNKVDFIVEQVHCAHTDCFFDPAYYDTLSVRKYFFPLPLTRIGNKIFINADLYNIPFGSEVLLINDHFAQELCNQLSFHNHTDGVTVNNKDAAVNDDFAYDYYLEFGPEKKFKIRYINGDTKEIESTTVPAVSLNAVGDLKENMFYDLPTDVPYDFTILDQKNTGVFTIRSFDQSTYSQQSAFTNFLDNSFSLMKLKAVKNLVIDYRNNAGGYFACSYKLLSYFISSPLMQFDAVMRRFRLLPFSNYVSAADSSMKTRIDGSYDNYSQMSKQLYKRKPDGIDTCFPANDIFRGNLFVLTNGNAISAAASSASLLKEFANATIVGEESGGAYSAFNSEILSYTLPNSGIKVDIPTLRYYPPVTRKENRNAIAPDYIVPLNIDDFMALDDGPLKFVLDSLIR